jgi:hypothetical protein
MVKGYRVKVIAGRYVGRWWAARSSKPVRGVRNFPGGFDSHVPPPIVIRFGPVEYINPL